MPSSTSDPGPAGPQPAWLYDLIGVPAQAEGGRFAAGGTDFEVIDGIPRQAGTHSGTQQQTADSFGFKWAQEDIYDQPEFLAPVRDWLVERYGNVAAQPWWDGDRAPVLLDAGCGAGLSALELFGDVLNRCNYLGADVSGAVDVARRRFATHGHAGAFIQCDLNALPLPPASVDMIFSEGVLHHTDRPHDTFDTLARRLKPGGRFLFYIYRKKGPIREFTDDHVRARLQSLSPQEAWDALEPLTQLGKVLGDLDIEIDVPEDIALLEIPKGKIDLQRLFYWHVAKAFYRPDWSLEQMNKINYDWYAPANASRHTLEELRGWCADADLAIEREVAEDAGITIIARKA